MNIFILDSDPIIAAGYYPDKLCNKISLEICQMLATNFSKEYLNWGELAKKDGKSYKISYPNHPCTAWMRKSNENIAWAITHGLALALEHRKRFGKLPATYQTLLQAKHIFHQNTSMKLRIHQKVEKFTRAMPDNLKNNKLLGDVEAYREYLHTKSYASWAKINNVPTWWGQTKLKSIKITPRSY